ncbi:MAG: hypothetical protein ACYC0V_19660 [Armatimonadota bacterium]
MNIEQPDPFDDASPEELSSMTDELARKVVSRRMETTAVLFLEMHKPMAFLANQSIIVASPFLVPLFGQDGVRKYRHVLGSRENVELLIRRIETLSDERDSTSKVKSKEKMENV